MIITRTPLRISLLGGGTDLPSFYNFHTGAVVSFAINKFVYVSVNRKFDNSYRVSYSRTENVKTVDEIQHSLVRESIKMFNIKHGLEITSVADIPGNGTGLGSSSSFTVGLIKALSTPILPSQLAERAFRVESEKCGHPVGKQDQYAASYGGMNYFTFNKSGVEVYPLKMSELFKTIFKMHCLLLWTGMNRNANEILDVQNRNFKTRGNIEIGKQLARLTMDFHSEFRGGMYMERLGEYLQESWKLKKFLAKGITNLTIDKIYENGMRAGAFGGKLLGAGGGGFFLFIAPPDRHKAIIESVGGLRQLDFEFEEMGSQVIYE